MAEMKREKPAFCPCQNNSRQLKNTENPEIAF
jgi:hypothetical protein